LRIACAITADSADSGHALVEADESAIRTTAHITAAIIGAPWIVLGVGLCANPRDAEESGGHEEESLHRRDSVWAVSHRNPEPGCFNPPCPESRTGFTKPIVSLMNDDDAITKQRIRGRSVGAIAKARRGWRDRRKASCAEHAEAIYFASRLSEG
jgi:hypothetical protein